MARNEQASRVQIVGHQSVAGYSQVARSEWQWKVLTQRPRMLKAHEDQLTTYCTAQIDETTRACCRIELLLIRSWIQCRPDVRATTPLALRSAFSQPRTPSAITFHLWHWTDLDSSAAWCSFVML